MIGTVQFESLIDLIAHYEKNPLYRKVCLTHPVNEEILSRQQNTPAQSNTNGSLASGAVPDDNYVSDPLSAYTDPSTNIRARALYDYTAQRDDELILVKNCIITNVQKKDPGWWKGDYGGRKQHWFPANFVQEIGQWSVPEPPLQWEQ